MERFTPATAEEWAVRMDAPDWSASDELALEKWLGADVKRGGELLQAQATWSLLASGGNLEEASEPITRMKVSRRSALLGGGGAFAASLVGAIYLLRARKTYATEFGEVRRLSLLDGSSAVINSASQVTVSWSDERRDVDIAAGEAWFRVAKDPARPFVVTAGDVRVKAIGTAFSVRKDGGAIDVLVSEGRVETWVEGTDPVSVFLDQGQRATFGATREPVVETRDLSSIDRKLAWRDGIIDLAGLPLNEAIADFNRYNRRKIRLDVSNLSQERLDGLFRTDDPEGFAKLVAESFDVSVDLNDPLMITLKKTTS